MIWHSLGVLAVERGGTSERIWHSLGVLAVERGGTSERIRHSLGVLTVERGGTSERNGRGEALGVLAVGRGGTSERGRSEALGVLAVERGGMSERFWLEIQTVDLQTLKTFSYICLVLGVGLGHVWGGVGAVEAVAHLVVADPLVKLVARLLLGALSLADQRVAKAPPHHTIFELGDLMRWDSLEVCRLWIVSDNVPARVRAVQDVLFVLGIVFC